MGTRVSTWAYSIHSELCHAPGHRIWERMQGESPQPHLLGRGCQQKWLPVETGRESIPTREGGAGVHCVPNERNSKCKGPGVREGGGVHGIPGELK